MDKFRLIPVENQNNKFRLEKSISFFGLHLYWDSHLKQTEIKSNFILSPIRFDFSFDSNIHFYPLNIIFEELIFDSEEEAISFIDSELNKEWENSLDKKRKLIETRDIIEIIIK